MINVNKQSFEYIAFKNAIENVIFNFQLKGLVDDNRIQVDDCTLFFNMHDSYKSYFLKIDVFNNINSFKHNTINCIKISICNFILKTNDLFRDSLGRGPDLLNFNSRDEKIYFIIRVMRNCIAHNDVWEINNHYARSVLINEIGLFDFTNLNKIQFDIKHINGIDGLYKIIYTCLEIFDSLNLMPQHEIII